MPNTPSTPEKSVEEMAKDMQVQLTVFKKGAMQGSHTMRYFFMDTMRKKLKEFIQQSYNVAAVHYAAAAAKNPDSASEREMFVKAAAKKEAIEEVIGWFDDQYRFDQNFAQYLEANVAVKAAFNGVKID
jgi:hypothetical protein